MKTLPILIILFCTVSFVAQNKSISDVEKEISALKDKKRFSVSYDKFKDETTLDLRINLYKNNSKLQKNTRITSFEWLIRTIFEGESVSNPKVHILCSYSSSPKWAFLDSRGLILLLDGKSTDLSEGSHDGKISRYGGVDEVVCWNVSDTNLNQILSSKEIEFQQGIVEGAIRQDKMNLFGEYLKLMQ